MFKLRKLNLEAHRREPLENKKKVYMREAALDILRPTEWKPSSDGFC